jgi:hypothetical protein
MLAGAQTLGRPHIPDRPKNIGQEKRRNLSYRLGLGRGAYPDEFTLRTVAKPCVRLKQYFTNWEENQRLYFTNVW